MKRTTACFLVAMAAFSTASFAADIFVAPEGRGGMTGADWSNALNGSRNGFHIDVKSAITAAVAGGATEVNVYFAGGTYAITNQLGLSSIAIPVKLSGGYLAETDGSLAKGETATTFSRTANNIRFVSASSMSALRIEGITFSGGYISASGSKNSHTALGAKGGAVAAVSSMTTISNCVFRNNAFQLTTKDARSTYASFLGGGGAVAATISGSLNLEDCTFEGNHHTSGGTYNQSCGGAVLGYQVNLTVRGCTFKNNYMDGSAGRNTLFGGAIGSYYGNVAISNCTFSGNYIKGAAYSTGGSSGGALAIRDTKTFRMCDSTFNGNYVANISSLNPAFTAGIVLLDDWNTSDGITTSCVERCVFDSRTVANSVNASSGNVTLSTQGDILVCGGRLFMTNNVIFAARGGGTYGGYSVRSMDSSSTSASYWGYLYSKWTCAPCSLELVNCTIADGQTYGAAALGTGELSVKNCIAYGNSVSGVVNAASIEYSCIQEPHAGAGNFVADPHWTGSPYYHLLTKRASGAITDGWFDGTYNSAKTEKNSPCLDAGAPGSAGLDLEPFPNGRHVNLGAYGGTPWATKTLSPPGTTVFVQ